MLAEDSIKRAIQDWEEKKAGRTTSWIDEMQKKDDKSMIGHNSNNVETYPENGM